MSLPPNHPIHSLPSSVIRGTSNTRFAPKLTDDDRRAILALDKAKVSRHVIAAVYNVDRRTVGHVCNPHSPHYRGVRNDYKNMGHDEFLVKYLTADVVAKVKEYKPDLPAPSPSVKGSSARYKAKAGLHKVQPEQCSYEHHIEIAFQPTMDPPGWYYRDLDHPEQWLHNGPDSLVSSQAALHFAVSNLTDD